MKNKFINKRKNKFFSTRKFMILFFFLLILIIFHEINNKKIINASKDYIKKHSINYGYSLKFIEVSELKYLEKNEILKSFNLFKNKSIFFIPFHEISIKVKRNKWIKDIQIKSNYKDSVKVFIEEEIPYGVYENKNHKLLFSSNLVILEIIEDKRKYSNLITFYGKNSINMSKKLLLNFDNNFYQMVDSATYINNRRWDILLKNNINLLLPEKKIPEAIKNYKKIYDTFSNKDLKNIQSVDLRLKKQAIIKYKAFND